MLYDKNKFSDSIIHSGSEVSFIHKNCIADSLRSFFKS